MCFKPKIFSFVEKSTIKSYLRCIFNAMTFLNEGLMSCKMLENSLDFPLIISQNMFNLIDKDQDGTITLDEFVEFMFILINGKTEERIELLFRLIDFDRDGLLNIEDATLMFYHLSIKAHITNIVIIKQIINNFFKGSTRICLEKFKSLTTENSDLVIFFMYLTDHLFKLDEKLISFISQFVIDEGLNDIQVNVLNLKPPTEILNRLLCIDCHDDNFEELSELDAIEFDLGNEINKVNMILNKNSPLTYKNTSGRDYFDQNTKASSGKNNLFTTHIPVYKKLRNFELTLIKIENKKVKQVKLIFTHHQILELEYNDQQEKYILSRIFLKWNDVNIDKEVFVQGNKYSTVKLSVYNNNLLFYSLYGQLTSDFIQCLRKYSYYQDINLKYSFGNKIGSGTYSVVYSGMNKATNEKVAIKVIDKDAKNYNLNNWEKEIFRIIQKLPHKRIIGAIEMFENEKCLYFIYEYEQVIPWGTRNLNENEIKIVVYQIAEALEHLNELGIVHHDIKLDNVLLVKHATNLELEVKLIDFGFSKIIGKYEYLKERYGTVIYSAPELIEDRPFSFQIDIWSLGVLTYYLNFQEYPFGSKFSNVNSIAKLILKGTYSYPTKKDRLKILIDKCLTKEVNRRITPAGILELLYI